MSMLPIKLPPGVFRNGTRYQTKGRWIYANRVRWHNEAMRPIGGWVEKSGPTNGHADDLTGANEYVRDGHSWRTNQMSQITVWLLTYLAISTTGRSTVTLTLQRSQSE